MPITGISWVNKSDRHLLPGQLIPDLRPDLEFESGATRVTASAYLASHADVTLEFQPVFKGTHAPPLVTAAGLEVNTITGQVKYSGVTPDLRKNNFILRAVAKNTGDGHQFEAFIRLQVHGSVKAVWLTPPILTIRPLKGAFPFPQKTGSYFDVRIQFDDDVVEDVTALSGLQWTPTNLVGPNGNLVIPSASAGPGPVAVTVKLPATHGGFSASAKVVTASDWGSVPTLPKVSLVPGGASAAPQTFETQPNVLFISDGYLAGESNVFETVTSELVRRLCTKQMTRPFDLLKDSFNYWRAFLPASVRGTSYKCHMFTDTDGGQLVAKAVPGAEKPPSSGGWRIEHLIYAVGLPVTWELKNRSDQQIRDSWKTLLDSDPGTNVDNKLFGDWKKLATRTFIEEIDTFPGLVCGFTPSAMDDIFNPPLYLYDGRNTTVNSNPDPKAASDRREFYPFLAGDQGRKRKDNSTIGSLWSARKPGEFNNPQLVVVISGGKGLAANGHPAIALSPSGKFEPVPVAPHPSGRNELVLKLPAANSKVSPDSYRTLAHELGHSFGLKDEYVVRPDQYPFPKTQAEFVGFANVQADSDVRSAGKIQGDQILWNWMRIQKAAVVIGAISQGGGGYVLPLGAGSGALFATNATVFLRSRKIAEVIGKANTLTIAGPMVIQSRTGDVVTVAAKSGATIPDLRTFSIGSVLFVPVPAPASVQSPAYPYAEMVAKNIKELIISTGQPLYRRPTGSALTEDVRREQLAQEPVLGNVPMPKCFKHKPEIVGLYEGGATYPSGIYHPTGLCVMRRYGPFCPVCRYILVDVVDPTKHGDIDSDYDDIYPLT